jgi:hypothetical protein
LERQSPAMGFSAVRTALASSNRTWLGAIRGRVPNPKVSNNASNIVWVNAAGQRLRLPAPQRDSLRRCDTRYWCSRRESNPEPWD